MTLKYELTKAFHRNYKNTVWVCVGCRELGIMGSEETMPFKVPDYVMNNPDRNHIESHVCQHCKPYISRRVEELKKEDGER